VTEDIGNLCDVHAGIQNRTGHAPILLGAGWVRENFRFRRVDDGFGIVPDSIITKVAQGVPCCGNFKDAARLNKVARHHFVCECCFCAFLSFSFDYLRHIHVRVLVFIDKVTCYLPGYRFVAYVGDFGFG